jgi:hypothetical protein
MNEFDPNFDPSDNAEQKDQAAKRLFKTFRAIAAEAGFPEIVVGLNCDEGSTLFTNAQPDFLGDCAIMTIQRSRELIAGQPGLHGFLDPNDD